MIIRVDVGGRDYGGYPCNHFTVRVAYTGMVDDGDFIDFDRYPEYLEQLSSILLGQKSPMDIKDKWDTYVCAGEIVTRLQVKAIAENWSSIDFTETPWASRISQMKQRYADEAVKRSLAKGRHAIEVRFKFLEATRQRAGSFRVSREVAGWLGEQLVALANGALAADGATVEVKQNREISTVEEQ